MPEIPSGSVPVLKIIMTINTIKDCFETILCGEKEESREAARKVSKILYSASTENKEKYDDIKEIIESAPDEYFKISEDWRRENLVVAISVIYFLHNREEEPDFLFPWFFQLLQHSNGVIRYAVVRMIAFELGPLSAHIRISDYKSEKLKQKQADDILYALFVGLNELLNMLWEPKFKKYKYISSLPVSPYKSVQMVLASMEEHCGRKHIDYWSKNY